MPKEKMWVEWGDGTHLSQSHKKPGDFSALTRDDLTNELGQATLRPIQADEDAAAMAPMVFVTVSDRDDGDDRYAAISAVVVELAKVLIPVAREKLEPVVRQWWNQDKPPALRSAWNRLTKSDDSAAAPERALCGLVEESAQARAQDAAVSLEHASTMSAAEWRERFLTMLLAGAIRDEQWDALATARVEDGDAVLRELQTALAALTPQELSNMVRHLLQGPNPVFDEEALARVTRGLGLAAPAKLTRRGMQDSLGQVIRNRDEQA